MLLCSFLNLQSNFKIYPIGDGGFGDCIGRNRGFNESCLQSSIDWKYNLKKQLFKKGVFSILRGLWSLEVVLLVKEVASYPDPEVEHVTTAMCL